jgi:hypothetical protein
MGEQPNPWDLHLPLLPVGQDYTFNSLLDELLTYDSSHKLRQWRE